MLKNPQSCNKNTMNRELSVLLFVVVSVVLVAWQVHKRRCYAQRMTAQPEVGVALTPATMQATMSMSPLQAHRPPPLRIDPTPPPSPLLPPLPDGVRTVATSSATKPDIALLRRYLIMLRSLQPQLKEQVLDANLVALNTGLEDIKKKSADNAVRGIDARGDYITTLILAHEQWRALSASEKGRGLLEQLTAQLNA
jgi:hypothetical protein